MDNSKIGNARQQDDNRIAVAHACRLGDCCRKLAEIYMRSELSPTDYVPEQMEVYRILRGGGDTPDVSQWIKTCIMRDKATRVLRSAIASGNLQIWRVHDARDIPLAPVDLQSANIHYSVFKSFERPEPDMQGAHLWVKCADWARFIAGLGTVAESVNLTKRQPGPSDGDSRKGRTKGTGYQRADAPLLERMKLAIADNPSLNATSAAKLVADEAVGASFEAKVDRLARAFRAGNNGE